MVVRYTQRGNAEPPGPILEPRPWTYGWTLTNLNMETILGALGTGRLYIGHAPGGSIREMASTHYNASAAGRARMRWGAFTVSMLDARTPVLLGEGEIEVGPVYGVSILWRPQRALATVGYLQPIYLDLRMVEGAREQVGTMTMTILMGGAS